MGVRLGVHLNMNFSWDEDKRISNLKKHGIDFIDAEALFDGRPVYTYPSPRENEARFVTVGFIQGIAVAVVWVERDDTVRLISLRRARDGEKRTYRKLYG
jgi:uncharacterized DUF497 family protein